MKKNIGSTMEIIEDCRRGGIQITSSIEKMMKAPADFLPHTLVDFNEGIIRYNNEHMSNALLVLTYYFGETLVRNLEGVQWVEESAITGAGDLYVQVLLPFRGAVIPVDVNPAAHIKKCMIGNPEYLYSQFCLYETMLDTVRKCEVESSRVRSLIIKNDYGTYRYDFSKLQF